MAGGGHRGGEPSLSLFLVREAPRCEGVGNAGRPSCSIGRGREAAQGHEAQMDVRATSVAPPGWLLSAATLPHTLDGGVGKERESEREKRGILCRV